MNQMTIIGGGAAGVGIGIMLEQLGCSQFQILEQEEIGASFRRWPKKRDSLRHPLPVTDSACRI